MSPWILYLLLLRATALSFSGFASVPVLREDLVERRGMLSDGELNTALAVSQITPGPLGLYVVAVGYFVAGVPGAFVGMAALATPALLAIPLLKLVRRQNATLVQGASVGIVLASSVLMGSSAMGLAPGALESPFLVIAAGAAFVLLAMERLAPVVVVAGTAVLSLAPLLQ
ncbi:MAG: chromate transporter [Planctomycetota bacterium]|nr:chromate transporter [Planctomycetota bacterium]